MMRTADTFISEFEKEEGLWNVKSEKIIKVLKDCLKLERLS